MLIVAKKSPLKSPAIAQAIEALQSEEASLTEEISALQSRVSVVRTALSSMRALNSSRDSKSDQMQLSELAPPLSNTYDGLPFSKALTKYMSTISEPMTAKEISIGMSAAGYRFTSNNETTQVYVGLTRNEGTLFERVENKWKLKA